MSPTDSGKPETKTSAASTTGKPDGVTLKDVLKPSSLIIALTASVLFILFGWYLYVLKPALDDSNPMDIRLTKKPFLNTPFPQELISKTEVETQSTDNGFEPSNQIFEKDEKSDVVEPNKPTSRVEPTQRTLPTISAKSNTSRSKKVVTVQSEDVSLHQNEHIQEVMKPANISAENKRPEKNKEVAVVEMNDEDPTQKIKAFAAKWKESILIPATQPICSQVQIAMNQCQN